jgi:hypothetical protein
MKFIGLVMIMLTISYVKTMNTLIFEGGRIEFWTENEIKKCNFFCPGV